MDFGRAGTLTVSGNSTSYALKSDDVALQVNAASNSGGSLGITSANLAVNKDDLLLDINAGLDSSGSNSMALTGASLAWKVGESSALGTNLSLSKDKSEVILNGVSDFMPRGIRLRGALSYMQGNQDFDFYKTKENVKLSQLAYYTSAAWVKQDKAKQCNTELGLQSAGVALWGAQAKNHSTFSGIKYPSVIKEGGKDYWVVTSDRRLISAGTLRGVSANAQYAPRLNLVVQAALGAETIEFPFSDGSSERTTAPYIDAKVSYQINPRNTVSVAYKQGVTEQGVRLEWQSAAYTVSAYKTKGQNGMQGSGGVNLNLDVLGLFSKTKSKSSGLSLAAGMRPRMEGNTAQRLRESVTRPAQLPSNFLAKVDPTGVTQIVIEKKDGIDVDENGNLHIKVGDGSKAVHVSNGATLNKNIVDPNGFSELQGNVLVVYLDKLRYPSSGKDDYWLLIDNPMNGDHHYEVTFSATKVNRRG